MVAVAGEDPRPELYHAIEALLRSVDAGGGAMEGVS